MDALKWCITFCAGPDLVLCRGLAVVLNTLPDKFQPTLDAPENVGGSPHAASGVDRRGSSRAGANSMPGQGGNRGQTKVFSRETGAE